MVKKTISSNAYYFFGSLFSCISLIFLELQFPIFLFLRIVAAQFFFGCC